jgi:outer membrane protein assembly factor BamB
MNRREATLAISSSLITGIAGCISGTIDEQPDSCGEHVEISKPTEQATWPQFAAGPENSSFVPGAEPPSDNPAIAWRDLIGDDFLPPIVANDVYVADDETETVTAAEEDGTVRWQYTDLSRILCPPVASDNQVLVLGEDADGRHSLKALDAESGDVRWNTQVVPSFYGFLISVTGRDDTVFMGSDTGIHAIATDDGRTRWEAKLRSQESTTNDGAAWATPAVTADRVYTFDRNQPAADTRTVYAVNTDGTDGWEQELSVPERWELPGHPVAGDEHVFVTASYAALEHRSDTDGETVDDPTSSAPRSRLIALDTDSGDVRWQANFTDRITQSPAFADGILFVGTAGNDGEPGRLLAYDVESECLRWEYRSSDGIVGTPAVTPKTVYISENSRVTALSTADGTPSWHLDLDEGYLTTPIVAGHAVYVLGGLYREGPARLMSLS